MKNYKTIFIYIILLAVGIGIGICTPLLFQKTTKIIPPEKIEKSENQTIKKDQIINPNKKLPIIESDEREASQAELDQFITENTVSDKDWNKVLKENQTIKKNTPKKDKIAKSVKLMNMGVVMMIKGKYSHAEEAFRSVVKINIDDIAKFAHLELIRALKQQNKNSQAEQETKKIKENYKNDKEFLKNIEKMLNTMPDKNLINQKK